MSIPYVYYYICACKYTHISGALITARVRTVPSAESVGWYAKLKLSMLMIAAKINGELINYKI